MAGPYYVDSNATGGSQTGADWANAFLTLKAGVEAATAADDLVKVAHNHAELLTADTTVTVPADRVRVICVNSGTEAATTGAVVGTNSTTNYAYIITAGNNDRRAYFYGIRFQVGTHFNVGGKYFKLAPGDGNHFEFENCVFDTASAAIACPLQFGEVGAALSSYVKLKNCTIVFNFGGSYIAWRSCRVDLEGLTISGSAVPTTLVQSHYDSRVMRFVGCDLSAFDTGKTIFANSTLPCECELVNCRLGSGVTVMAPASGITHLGNQQVRMFNCGVGDAHYAFAHYDAFGSTVAQTTIYANDGAKYDGTNGVAWAITTTDNCSFYTPYVSPWFSQYAEAGTVTPTVEIVRDGSATAYQDDEVWGEFSYQGTSGSTKATIVSTRTAVWPLAPDDIPTGDLGAGDWTGENATAWFGKLSPGSITINEIGHLSARIVVGEPSITVGADPTIRV